MLHDQSTVCLSGFEEYTAIADCYQVLVAHRVPMGFIRGEPVLNRHA
jgi:hypothetical protein